jgi:signal transduction histidine kinase
VLNAQALEHLAGLADPTRRRQAGQALAVLLGADDLIVFVRDPEVDALLAAPGFPQTLPGGRTWRTFLEACLGPGHHTAELPYPDASTTTPATGLAGADGSVLVLLGGAPLEAEVAGLRLLLPILAAVFHGEQSALTATAQATIAREAAAQAKALAESLDAARYALQRELHTREDFLASASHDLKNPLAAINGTAQLLRRRLTRGDSIDPDQLATRLAQIESTAAQMAAQIDEMLDVTRLRMGSPLELDRRPTDLVVLARRAADAHQQATDKHRIRVETSETGIEGDWDPARIRRVIGNLLGNAIKYSPDGDIVVQLARADDAPYAVITVRDQGIGIAQDDLPHVFERFQRGRNVVGRIAGTGIGLAASKQIVEQHEGTITVESRLGEGSTFTIRLPLGTGEDKTGVD